MNWQVPCIQRTFQDDSASFELVIIEFCKAPPLEPRPKLFGWGNCSRTALKRATLLVLGRHSVRKFMNPHRNVRRPQKSFILFESFYGSLLFHRSASKAKANQFWWCSSGFPPKLTRIAVEKSIIACSCSRVLKLVECRLHSSAVERYLPKRIP